MDLIPLTADYELKPFDCGDADLNGFLLNDAKSFSIFRFLTVDAYLSAIPFYEKNDFKLLQPADEDKHTRLMYFDMARL